MKFVTDRQELAKDINIKGIPVITMDISRPLDGDEFYKDCYGGSKIRVAYQTRRYGELHSRCRAKMFGDEVGNKGHHDEPWKYKRIHLSCPCVGISAEFNLHDAREMNMWSNTRILHAGDEVYVFFDRGDRAFYRKMRVGRVDSGCSTVAMLEDVDE